MDETYSDEECVALFKTLFPTGFAGAEVLSELAPQGWPASPLCAAFHPSVQQVYEDAVRSHRNLEEVFGGKGERPSQPEPTFEKVAASYHDPPVEPERELAELMGRCLWDVFSDNHEIVAPDGRIVDLGSFRASGAFIAERLNEQIRGHRYRYTDFFLGSAWLRGWTDLTPVYELIFRRLHQRGFDWIHHFPRLALVDMRPLRNSLRPADEPEWSGYSPSSAIEREREEREHEQEVAKTRAWMDAQHRQAIRKARRGPPPWTVEAYQHVYGRLPRGWPPTA